MSLEAFIVIHVELFKHAGLTLWKLFTCLKSVLSSQAVEVIASSRRKEGMGDGSDAINWPSCLFADWSCWRGTHEMCN